METVNLVALSLVQYRQNKRMLMGEKASLMFSGTRDNGCQDRVCW